MAAAAHVAPFRALSQLDTTVFSSSCDENAEDAYVITGDITAMWIRDSTNQVRACAQHVYVRGREAWCLAVLLRRSRSLPASGGHPAHLAFTEVRHLSSFLLLPCISLPCQVAPYVDFTTSDANATCLIRGVIRR